MQLRLFFPLFQATQLVCGVATSYAKEIHKLRQFGIKYLTPYLRRTTLKKYPFKITITFYSNSSQDGISNLTITAFILHLFESNGVLQSTDYRVIPEIDIKMKHTPSKNHEGCEILIEKFKD